MNILDISRAREINSQIKPVSNLIAAFEEFLGVKVPVSFFNPVDEVKEIKLYNHEMVKDLVAVKEPALQIDRAIYLSINSSSHVLATMHISERMCAGHYPDIPTLPLALAAQYAGQAGELLINSLNRQLGTVLNAVEVIKTRSQRDPLRNRDYLFSGEDILYIAHHGMSKKGLHFVRVDLYNNGSEMGYLQRITYVVDSIERIKKQYQDFLRLRH